MSYRIQPCQRIRGTIRLPGDKSISHRSVIMSAIAEGKVLIRNVSFSDDCLATMKAMRSLGVKVKKINETMLSVNGVGPGGLTKPKQKLTVGESGTTMRILTGLLCAQNFTTVLDGREGLRKRPMHRVIAPLRLMGARIRAHKKRKNEYPPLHIFPASLKGITWKMVVPSAQVKSAIILAGMYAQGTTTIHELLPSRDHTERMLRHFKARITVKGNTVSIRRCSLTSPKHITVPGDISSASFFIVLACLLKDSCITIRDLSLNQTRSGAIEVLKRMGARIRIVNKKKDSFEPVGDLIVRSSRLKAVTVQGIHIPRLIDELPILMVAASFAKGRSIFQGVGELRVKETDRIHSMVENLSKMGIIIEIKRKANKEVISIWGNSQLHGASLKSFGDHRTAMSMIIAGLCANSPSRIDSVGCIAKSFPAFFRFLKHLIVL